MTNLHELIQDAELSAAEGSHYDEPLDWPEFGGVDSDELADFGGERDRD